MLDIAESKVTKMTTEKIINTIKESREMYLHHAKHSREVLSNKMQLMTGQQIQQEMLFITDMESRAYALKLLLEELEVEK